MNALTIPAEQSRQKTIKPAAIIRGCKSLTRALFSSRVSMAVTVVALAAIWWHSLTCPDTLAAQRAAGLDALLASPWLYCALIRKGGEA